VASLTYVPHRRQRVPMMDAGTLDDRTRPVRADAVRLSALLLRSGMSSRAPGVIHVEGSAPAAGTGRRD
jgi:hypothetical protein